ncbi:MAG: hypothetical protein JNM99_08850 [Verrucomicrobiaceae bacterium]|nr:hypothetical protein [Verrucomicrobiaceae bacterium]
MMKLWLVLLLATAASAFAQLANQPPMPMWLSGAPVVERSFTHEGKLLKAILLGAGEMEVVINDQPVGAIAGAEQGTSIDVTKFIRSGSNVLRLQAKAGRVAALLELNGDLANKTWIKTDASWTGTSGTIQTEAIDAKTNPFDFKKTFDAYNSWQLAKPGAQSVATDPSTFTLLPGFKAELVRSSQPGEDSWVSMTFDSEGRILLGREKSGLLRFDPRTQSTEVINDKLLECRGLLFVNDVLFANANNSKGLYRLEDKDGDGKFEDVREIVHSEGGVGHGRNHLKLGPDGWLYVAHGNNVLLPTNVSDKSPLKHYANDQLLPNPWDSSMFDGNVELPAGHVLRVKPDGSEVQLFAGGLRNPLDLTFNREGDLFTFDADMERDVGSPWYMPTRVLHVVPGADFGWRRGTGRYPSYYIDTLPSVIDIGLSSPTAVFFGYGAKFPAKYQEALFIFDWSYGRIIAVHLQPKGASYSGEQETFVTGRPLNVTDGCIGPDGAMWFITGGRGTQSGLYRITSEQPNVVKPPTLAVATPIMGDEASDDAFARHATTLTMKPTIDQLRETSSGWGAITRWLAAVRSEDKVLRDAAIATAITIDWPSTPEAQRLAVLRVLAVGLAREATPPKGIEAWLEARWTGKPSPETWELTKLLIHFRSPTIIARATTLLKAATRSEDQLFYPMHLRYLKDGWTLDQRRIVFEALNRAEKMNGASSYFKAIADTRAELAAALKPNEAKELASFIAPPQPVALSSHAMPAHSYKQWKLADLVPMLDKAGSGRSFESAKAALTMAQCVFCHRVSDDPTIPAGIVGPDLMQVSARFGRKDLLMHILEPSVFIDEKFKITTVTRVDGSVVSGALDHEDDERVALKPNPLAPEVVEIAKAQIKTRVLSDVSPMPAGLLNVLKADQILDLLAWFEGGGDPKARAWRN